MKSRKLLAVFTLIGLSANAYANEDFVSPLYVPSELETLSTTSLTYERTDFDGDSAKEDLILRETLLVGFSQETAIKASVGNRFNLKGITSEEYNNEHNFDYELGALKNWRTENGAIVQGGMSYYTYNPRSWYGRSHQAKEKIRENKGNGGTDLHQQSHTGGKQQGDLLTAGLSQALRDHLRKEIYDHRGHDSTDGYSLRTKLSQNQQRRQRRTAGMENIIADQHGSQCLIKMLTNPKGFLSTLIALVSHGTQTHLAHGSISGLTSGKICRTQ